MISIVRMQSEANHSRTWDDILTNKEEWQAALDGRGLMLYLTRRAEMDDFSIFVHTVDATVLGRFLTQQLCFAKALRSIWVVPLFNPVFFQLPRDTRSFMRHTVSLNVRPVQVNRVAERLLHLDAPDTLRMAYIANTFHRFDESIYYSVLARDEDVFGRHMEDVRTWPEVLNLSVSRIEKTLPLISYTQWVQYASQHLVVPSWNEDNMIDQFQE